jgi:hypothetical protein
MVALTAFSLGAAGQVMPGRLLRHTVGGLLRPAAAGLQVVSGCLAGPANTQGELALVSNTQLTVQPFRAVVQNSQDLTAGAYLVPSETVQTFTAGGAAGQTIPAQDASQFRRALVTLHVDDAQVAGSGGNASTLEVLPGALAATAGAAVLPATPANALNLGELLIPPTGQTVTLTPYNPRTMTRGGILPVLADGSVITGHDGAAPAYDGAPRWHPTYGLQIGRGGTWGPPELMPRCTARRSTTLAVPGTVGTTVPFDSITARSTASMWSAANPTRLVAPEAGEYDFSIHLPFANSPNPGGLSGQIRINGALPSSAGLVGYLEGRASNAWFGGEMTALIRGLELNANDYVEAYALQNSDSSRNLAAGARATLSLARR